MAAAHIDEREWEQEAYTTDAKGNKVINPDILMQKVEKGLLSPKVRSIVQTVFARPEVAQQLGIEGRYKYKGYTPELMIAQQESAYAAIAKQVQEAKDALTIQASVSTEQAAKNALEATALDKELRKFRENTDKAIARINEDFDGAKVDAYVNDETARLITNYSWSSISSKAAKSPAAEMALSRANYDLAVKKEIFDEWAKRKDLENDEIRLEIEKSRALIEKMKAENKLTAEGLPTMNYFTGAVDPTEEDVKGSGTFTDKTKELEVQRQQLQARLLSSLKLGFEDMYIEDKGVYRINWKNFNQKRYEEALKALAKAHLDGSITPELKSMENDFYNLTSAVMERNKRAKEIEAKYEPVFKDMRRVLVEEGVPAKIKLTAGWEERDSKQIDLDRDDFVQLVMASKGKYGFNSLGIGNTSVADNAALYLQKKYDLTEGQLKNLLQTSNRQLIGSGWSLAGYKYPLVRAQNRISGALEKNMTKREQDYKELQETTQYQYGLINTAKEENQRRVNSIFSTALSEALGDRLKTGNYKEVVKWLNDGELKNLEKNNYYVYRNPSGTWELQVRRNEDGAFKFSPKVQVSEQTALDLGARVDLNKDAFLNTFGNFLELNRWSKTTKDFTTNEAASTALLRHKIGKYSVGLHLKSFGDGTWMPFAYINDENGNPISNNVQINFSSYKNAKNLPEAERKRIADMPLLWKDADVIPQFMNLPESYIDLLINK